MSSSQTVKLLRAAPYFPVSDVERSARFYEQTLGFRCEYSAGTPLQFAIYSRDGLAIGSLDLFTAHCPLFSENK